MKLLYVTPAWPASDPWTERSSPWNERMMAMLYDRLAVVTCFQPPVARYGATVPVESLDPVPAPRWRHLARRMRLPVRADPMPSPAVLDRLLRRDDVTGAFVQFATTAVEFLPVLAASGKPVWVHCHGHDVTWDFRTFEFPHRPVRGPEYAAQVRELASFAVLVANSLETKRRLLEAGIREGSIAVKYLGVDVPAEPPLVPTGQRPIRILYLGRLVDCKGPDLTIKAFERACDNGLDADLTIAGAGQMMPVCELLRERSPYRERIRILGGVPPHEGERLRRDSDIFTAHNCQGPLTRQVEAYGVSVVEAMASALPVVTGASGGVCETVVDGVTGVLFDPGNVDAHAEALARLGGDRVLRHQMGTAGWERARGLFSAPVEQGLLADILDRHPQPDEASPETTVKPSG